MKAKHPATRTAAAAPRAAAHLTAQQQHALELSDEAEHSTGQRRERLTHAAKKLGQAEKK